MSTEESKDRKELLREKRELRMLERFMFEPKEKTFRQSTRNIINQDNYYSDLIKGQTNLIESDEKCKKKGKKRGRKPSNQNNSLNEEKKKNRKKKQRNNLDEGVTNDDKEITSTPNNNQNEDCCNDYMSITLSKDKNAILKEIESNDSFLSQSESVSLVNDNTNTNNKNIISLHFNNSEVFNLNNENNDNTFKNNNLSNSSLELSNILINGLNSSNGNGKSYHNNMEFSIQNETKIMREKLEKEYSREVGRYIMHKKLNSNNNDNDSTNLKSKTFINCDLRFFNFDLITSRIGHFDVIMMDPPWRIKGGQRNDSSFMFSNSKFNLEYNTLSNNEIVSLPVEKLSKKG